MEGLDQFFWMVPRNASRGMVISVQAPKSVYHAGAILKGELSPQEVQFFMKKKGTYTNIPSTDYPAVFIVSDYVIDLLRKHDISGWKAEPITVQSKGEKPIENYSAFIAVGTCGPFDDEKSPVVSQRRLGKSIKGFFLT